MRLMPILMLIGSNCFMTYAWYGHLKVMQEVITMGVFGIFCVFYMREPLKMDFVWAALCLVGAAYFMFRDIVPPPHPRHGMMPEIRCVSRIFQAEQRGPNVVRYEFD